MTELASHAGVARAKWPTDGRPCWLVGKRAKPQNKRMQLTKPAQAMELRS